MRRILDNPIGYVKYNIGIIFLYRADVQISRVIKRLNGFSTYPVNGPQ